MKYVMTCWVCKSDVVLDEFQPPGSIGLHARCNQIAHERIMKRLENRPPPPLSMAQRVARLIESEGPQYETHLWRKLGTHRESIKWLLEDNRLAFFRGQDRKWRLRNTARAAALLAEDEV